MILTCDVDADVAGTPGSARTPAITTARRRELALGRVAEFDVEGDVAAVDLDVLDRFRGHEIFIGIGVDDRGQGGLDVFCSDAHEISECDVQV
jgi:hypothetical protein